MWLLCVAMHADNFVLHTNPQFINYSISEFCPPIDLQCEKRGITLLRYFFPCQWNSLGHGETFVKTLVNKIFHTCVNFLIQKVSRFNSTVFDNIVQLERPVETSTGDCEPVFKIPMMVVEKVINELRICGQRLSSLVPGYGIYKQIFINSYLY